MEATLQVLLIRFIAGALYTAILAGAWDSWWHQAIGRDTFWELPHLLLYSAVLVAITAGVYGWYRAHERIWGKLALLLVLVPLSAPFDDFWHHFFGVEDISSPLVIWSPPHLFLVSSLLGSLFLVLALTRRDEAKETQTLFGTLTFAAILWLSLFLAAPFYPTGPYEVIGFWGAAMNAFAISAVILMAKRRFTYPGSLVPIIALFLLPLIIGSHEEEIAPGVLVNPHDHPPIWLVVFSFLVPAGVLDLFGRLPLLVKGGFVGFLWSGILYGFSSSFFAPEFQYGLRDTVAAIFASIVGGLIAGFVISRFYEERR